MDLTTRTYGTLIWRGRSWWITDFPPYISMKLKRVFRQISSTATEQFHLFDNDDICSDLLWFCTRYPFKMNREARQRLEDGHKAVLAREKAVDAIFKPNWQPKLLQGFRDGYAPYPFQAQAGRMTATLRSLLLMDDVGLGKTISSLAAIAETRALPAAIVVQAHLADQWREFIEEFTEFRPHIIKGRTPYKLPEADIYIFKYSNIAGWVDIFTTRFFQFAVFDEMQELRHGVYTKKGEASKVLCEFTRYRMGLTATPIYNYGSEIFNIVDMLNEGALGSVNEFITEWCVSRNAHWVAANPDALGAYLKDHSITLRRTEEDVDGQMPPVNTLLHEVPYDQDIVDDFLEVARSLAIKVLSGEFTERGKAARELDLKARQVTGVAKARHVAAVVRMLVESGEHVLVGAWHREVYDIWNECLADLDPVMYTGSESTPQKRRSKQAFVEGPARPMLISLRSGAGLDGLQKVCNTAVIGELDWSPQVHKQLIGRLRRPGQEKQVDAIYCHTNGGSDPLLIEMLGLKASQSQGIVDPLKGAQPVHTDDSRIKLLAERFLERK
ncbi:DEAD/DEAH box helicase [Hoeflea poritis]|uniref:DEAD/DEAH box helicase n=1 Tax=Hoeflea poritis TaxID=2993659 RepID=A0ABT4VMQ0_9HYPH|nr:DEAD/DEAH box helicase [Hoeflea poritis]MDA4845983.1 DEAD/DEAH box helicase [Hoeflea poritis]